MKSRDDSVLPARVKGFFENNEFENFKDITLKISGFGEPLVLVFDDYDAIDDCENWLLETDEFEDNHDDLLVLAACAWLSGGEEREAFLVIDTSDEKAPVKYFNEDSLYALTDSFDDFITLIEKSKEGIEQKKEEIEALVAELNPESSIDDVLQSPFTYDDLDDEEGLFEKLCSTFGLKSYNIELEIDEDSYTVSDLIVHFARLTGAC